MASVAGINCRICDVSMFNIGELVVIKHDYFDDLNCPNTGIVWSVINANDHELKSVRDAGRVSREPIYVVSIMLGDGIIREYFDDEVERCSTLT